MNMLPSTAKGALWVWLSCGAEDETIILDFLGGPNIITRILIREERRQESQRERLEDAMLLALKVEERTMSQEIQTASRSWKRQGKPILPRVSKKECSLVSALIFAQ